MIYCEQIEIGLEDIEKDNFLSNKAILKYLENIAGHHSDSIGYGLNSIKENHLTWVLLEWKVKVIKRIEYGQKLTIKTWSRSIERCYGNRDFEIYDDNNELCVIATSKWLLINTENGSITKADEEMISKYDSETDKSVFKDFKFEKLVIPQNFENSIFYKAMRKDIDIVGHMHNLNYLDLAYEALPDEVYKKRLFNNIRITYKKEIKLGDIVECKYACIDNKQVVVIESNDEKVIHAIIELG